MRKAGLWLFVFILFITSMSCDYRKQNDAEWQLRGVYSTVVGKGLRLRRGSAEVAFLVGMTNRVCQLSMFLGNLPMGKEEIDCIDPWLRPIIVKVLEVEDMEEFLRCELYFMSMGPDPSNERRWLKMHGQIFFFLVP